MKLIIKILAITGVYLFSLCVLSTETTKSLKTANSDVYAGRYDKKPNSTKYNLSGLPVSQSRSRLNVNLFPMFET